MGLIKRVKPGMKVKSKVTGEIGTVIKEERYIDKTYIHIELEERETRILKNILNKMFERVE